MADKYWVGGSGTWNGDGTGSWSNSSGGSANASFNTSSDRAIFDANSGSGTVTLEASVYIIARAIIVTSDCNITINGSSSDGLLLFASSTYPTIADINRSMTSTAMEISSGTAGTYSIICTSGLRSFKFSGNLPSYTFNLNSILSTQQFTSIFPTGTGFEFNSNGYQLSSSGYITLATQSDSNVLNFNNSQINASNGDVTITSGGSGSSIIFSNSAVTAGSYNYDIIVTSNSGSSISFTNNSLVSNNFTLTNNGSMSISGSSVQINGNASIASGISLSGTNSLYKVSSTSKTFTINTSGFNVSFLGGTGELILENSTGGTTSVNDLEISRLWGASSLSLNNNLTVAGTLSLGEYGGVSVTGVGGAKTLTSNSYTLKNVTWQNITAAGAIPFTGTGFVDAGGNTNIEFYVHRQSLFFAPNF